MFHCYHIHVYSKGVDNEDIGDEENIDTNGGDIYGENVDRWFAMTSKTEGCKRGTIFAFLHTLFNVHGVN